MSVSQRNSYSETAALARNNCPGLAGINRTSKFARRTNVMGYISQKHAALQKAPKHPLNAHLDFSVRSNTAKDRYSVGWGDYEEYIPLFLLDKLEHYYVKIGPAGGDFSNPIRSAKAAIE